MSGVRKIQPMWFLNEVGVPTAKGLEMVLKERGKKIQKGWNRDRLRLELAKYPDFKEQKGMISEYLTSQNHLCDFLPKFHCELNEMELIWALMKHRFAKTIHLTRKHIRQDWLKRWNP
eukprot:303120_1